MGCGPRGGTWAEGQRQQGGDTKISGVTGTSLNKPKCRVGARRLLRTGSNGELLVAAGLEFVQEAAGLALT